MGCWDSHSQASFQNRNICYNFLYGRFFIRFLILYNNNIYSINYSITNGLGIACTCTFYIWRELKIGIKCGCKQNLGELYSQICETMRPEVNTVPTKVMQSSLFFPVGDIHAIIHFLLLHPCSSRCWKNDEELLTALMVLGKLAKATMYYAYAELVELRAFQKQWFLIFFKSNIPRVKFIPSMCHQNMYIYMNMYMCINYRTPIPQINIKGR